MTTSPITFPRRARRAALALTVSTILVPASSALARPADFPGTPANPQTAPPAASLVPTSSAPAQGDTPADFPGNPQTPPAASLAPASSAPAQGDTPSDFPGTSGSAQTPPAVASHAPQASGFDWMSAAIGAGGAGVLIVVSLGGATAASRLHFRTMRS